MKLPCRKKGYTLIEAVMVIVLIAIIGFGFGNFIITSMQSSVSISGRDAAINTVRMAMNRVLAELRRINRAQNILTSVTNEVWFVDLDGQPIDFKQSGTNLMRNSDILITSLGSPEGLRFKYLDENGSTTEVKANMRSIRVWLMVALGTQRATLESSARIRNPK